MNKSIKQMLADGEMVRCFGIGQFPVPKWVDLVGQVGGYHGVWIDQEHAGLAPFQIEQLCQACRGRGLDSMVRIAPTDYATVMRPMEAGAGGIMAAQVQSAEDAARIVSWSKYPPEGSRGMNLGNFEGDWGRANAGEFALRANRDNFVSIQIETVGALEEAEQIAALPGVDHLFIGPMDLSVALSVPGDFLHEKCVTAMKRVAQAVKLANKSWGILPRSAEHAQLSKSLGAQLFVLAFDFNLILRGLKSVREDFAALFPA